MPRGLELLTAEEMSEADRRAIAGGLSSLSLMENAGKAVAEAVRSMAPVGSRILVLCGPGNNGGDGFVAARHLKHAYDVRVFLLGAREALKGDAAEMARRFDGPLRPIEPGITESMDVVVDALFGAGLRKPLEGPAALIVAEVNASGLPVVAVDVPSGVDASSGAAKGPVITAQKTVTFFRRKPGHLLLPARAHCGEVLVADIGIPASVLEPPVTRDDAPGARQPGPERSPALDPAPLSTRGDADTPLRIATYANAPALWLSNYPWPSAAGHKYSRGHAVIVSGPAESTGAARLGARGALRIGAGLVTVVGGAAATAVNAAQLTAIMTRIVSGARGLAAFLEDRRRNAVLIGPGAGVGAETADLVLAALASDAAVLLDADALTSFAEPREASGEGGFGFTSRRASEMRGRDALFSAIRERKAPAVLTPHEGELARLFPGLSGSKLERARTAAKESGAVVILKGADTVVAAPDGRAAINENGPPWLATAGSGDVLAGFVAGLVAQHMPAFEAACAAVWLHGDCASAFGPGLIAEDIPEEVPTALTRLRAR